MQLGCETGSGDAGKSLGALIAGQAGYSISQSFGQGFEELDTEFIEKSGAEFGLTF